MPPVTAPVANKYDLIVRQELTKASQKIRFNDLLTGALALGVVILAYAAITISLDRLLELPSWLRQLGIVGFLGLLAGVGYFTLWLPMRRVINPRYAARQVEATVPDAQNSLINWVDLQDENLPASVKAAVAARAAEGISDADINKATESKRILWLGAVLGILFATLAALFIAFKPNPFFSLLNRAFNPFNAGRIASKTELTLTEPQGGDVTITSGESLTISVFVSGSIPDKDSPNRLRVHVRQTPDSPEFDEFPLEQTGGSREWSVRLPASVIQSGLWYAVFGNDATTSIYQVTVRSRPIVKGFEATYVYPPYLRMKDEVDRDPRLTAYKGTDVTLLVKTNRTLRRGWLQLDGKPDTLTGDILRESPDTMRFRLNLMESGSYRVGFTSTDDETSEPTAPYPIRVLIDQAPTITIERPTEETVMVPLNGRLELDATFSDDFGLGQITLKLRASDNGEGYSLQDRKHRNHEALPLGEDASPAKTYTLKETLNIQDIKFPDGKPVNFAVGQIIEYWYEATDICTVPKPNVGRSGYKRIKFTKEQTMPEEVASQKKATQKRNAEEKQHQAKQDQELKQAKRPAEQLRPEADKPEQQPENPPQEKKNEGGEPGTKQGAAEGKKGNDNQPQADGKQDKQPKTDKTDAGKQGTTEPMPKKEKEGGTETPPEGQPSDPMKGGEMSQEKTGKAENKAGGEKSKEKGSAEKNAETPPEGQPSDPMKGGEKSQEKTGKADNKAGGEKSKEKGSAQKNAETQPGTEKSDEVAPMPKKGTVEQTQQDRKIDEEANNLREKVEKQERDQFGQARPESGEKSPEEAPMPKSGGTPNKQDNPKKESGNDTPMSQPKEGKSEPRGESKPEPKDGQPGQTGERSQEKPMNGQGQQKPEEQPGQAKPEPGQGSAGPKEKSELSRNLEKPPKGELSRETGKDGEKVEPPDEDVERLIRKGDDLDSNDQKKREDAEKEFDERFGKEKREELQEKMRSKEQKKRDEAKKDIDELAKKKKNPPKGNGGEPKKDRPKGNEGGKSESGEELKQQAQDLNSNDPMKREAAEKKFDEKLGKQGREQLQKDMKDAQNGTPEQKQSAQERVNDALDKAAKPDMKKGEKGPKSEQNGKPSEGKNEEKKLSPEEMKQLAEKAQDLASPDAAKREKAEKDFDKMMGEENRKKLQQEMNELNSSDQKRREDAQRRLENQAEEAMKKNGDKNEKKPTEKDLKDLAEKAKDLNSTDPAKQEAARKELDQKLGKENREKLEKEMNALNSKDPMERKAAEERIKKAAEEMAKQAKEKPPSKEDVEKFAKEAEKLASKDEKERQEAEKKFDENLGEEARKQLQKDMEDMKSGDQKRQQEAMKRMQNAMKNSGALDQKSKLGGSGRTDQEGKTIEDDPKNRLKTAELQLKTLKEAQKNQEAIKELGYTPEEYERFLKAYEERVKRLRDEVSEAATNPNKGPTGPTTLKVGEGSGGKKLETRSDGTAGVNAGGAGTAPPGYSDAQKRFAEEAAKLRKSNEKK